MNTIDILWYGRGGQGAFSAAKLLGASYALKDDASYALAFPSFGPERRGAPVKAYTKLSDRRVNDRSAVTVPDYAICLDSTLLADFSGLQIKEGGFVLSTTPAIEGLAAEVLGRPIVNTALLALLCSRTGLIGAEAIQAGIEQTLPERIRRKNALLVETVFDKADELLVDALSEPSGQTQVPPAAQNAAFEYMDLQTADAFGAPQRVYGVPHEGSGR